MSAELNTDIDARCTTAALLAGRVIDEYVATVGHLREIRKLSARQDDVAVVVAGHEDYAGAPSDPAEGLYSRIAIGLVVAAIRVGDPLGPIAPHTLMAGLTNATRIPKDFWQQVAKQLGPAEPLFAPATRRAALPEGLRDSYEGIAFDGPDLLTTSDHIHLVATGPLASAVLVEGIPAALPLDEDGYLDCDQDCEWQYGSPNGDLPKLGVRGGVVACAPFDGGTCVVHPKRLSPNGDYSLIAKYD